MVGVNRLELVCGDEPDCVVDKQRAIEVLEPGDLEATDKLQEQSLSQGDGLPGSLSPTKSLEFGSTGMYILHGQL